MTLIEMEGFLRGKRLPGDILVGETNAQYLLRKLNAATELQRQLTAYEATVTNLTAQMHGLAAENAALKHALEWLYETVSSDIVSIPDEKYSAVTNAAQALSEAPNTDAALAEMRNDARASVIPEGFVLVPQQIFLDASDIESICSQCGDGGPNYGDFSDGLLWVGDIQKDDGSIVHGLHISSADYPEEGGITICEFAQQLRKEQGK